MGKRDVLDTRKEIQERHDAVKDMDKNLKELHQVFLDMVVLVQAQGEQLDDIESHVARANSFMRSGAQQLQTARKHQKNTRKWTCHAINLLLIIILIVILSLKPWNWGGNSGGHPPPPPPPRLYLRLRIIAPLPPVREPPPLPTQDHSSFLPSISLLSLSHSSQGHSLSFRTDQ